MSIDDLYHDGIMELARSGVGAGEMDQPDGSFTVNNPLCGDRVTMHVRIKNSAIVDVKHRVRGCALCQASAAMLAKHASNLLTSQISSVAEAAEQLLKDNSAPQAQDWPDLALFKPVGAHRSRHDCVLLPFKALAQAIQAAQSPSPVET